MSLPPPEIIISCIIPASEKDKDSQVLKDLINSIKTQDFPQDQIEILVITEGDSEQAKAIGIRQAKGEICAMFCADNYITDKGLFKEVHRLLVMKEVSAVYPMWYARIQNDNSLNRYFSLIGGNDPVCYYLGKNDRWPHVHSLRRTSDYQPSYGCNGFFYKAKDIKATDLDHYYPMDNALELKGRFIPLATPAIWHRTSDNLFRFMRKRYRYARDLYCDRSDRRWKVISTGSDYLQLLSFILCTLTVVQPVICSIRGFIKIRDFAWFWHWPVCIAFLFTYGVLTVRTCLKRLLSFRPLTEKVSLKNV